MKTINRLAVFCGSKHGNNPLYAEHANRLGKVLAIRGIEMVYGGGKRGLMGEIANTVMLNTGIVRGVIPKLLSDREHLHEGLTELMIVEDMHTRKRMMYELCDAALILPGGFGTLDELFEILTWNALSIHDKPVFLLNTAGFYDHLLAHVKMLANEGFLWDELEKQLTVLNEPEDLP